jgi:hypothetical protein
MATHEYIYAGMQAVHPTIPYKVITMIILGTKYKLHIATLLELIFLQISSLAYIVVTQGGKMLAGI